METLYTGGYEKSVESGKILFVFCKDFFFYEEISLHKLDFPNIICYIIA